MATRRRQPKPVVIPFNGPAYELDSIFLSSQLCRNFYLRSFPDVDKESYVLEGSPGLVEWLDTGSAVEIRGQLKYGSYTYAVAGSKLIRVSAAKVKVELGTLNTSTGRVGMATNGLDLVVVDGVQGWMWDYSLETFAQITDPDFPVCKSIIHTDGYYLVPKDGTGQIWRSDFNDGSSWGGLAFSTAGSEPDNLVAIALDNKDVYTIGENTTEIWYNSGAATFNFDPIIPAFIQMGGVGPFAVTNGNNALYWVAKDKNGQGRIVQCTGRIPATISTPFTDEKMKSWGDLSDIQMWSYEQLGHVFVVITSPSGDETLVFDSTEQKWHERSSRIGETDGRWRVSNHVLFNNLNLVGDKANGKIYELSPTAYDEDGSPMISIRRTPVIRDVQGRITINRVQVITQPGVGLSTGDDADVNPYATLKWSRDGGRTYPLSESIPLGAIGEVENTAEVLQLGQGVNWVFELSISAKVKRLILGAVAEVVYDG